MTPILHPPANRAKKNRPEGLSFTAQKGTYLRDLLVYLKWLSNKKNATKNQRMNKM
jgi:hypothetical protein